MLVAFTSDLHTDLSERNEALAREIARQVARLRPDVFIIAGDLAETSQRVTQSLQLFSDLQALKLYLPGNHDLFVEGDPDQPGIASSEEKFTTLLPRAARAAGFEYLGLEPVRIGSVAVVGTPGWYDYSLRDPSLDCSVHASHYHWGQWRGLRGFDHGHVFWPRTSPRHCNIGLPAHVGGRWADDQELCEYFLKGLDEQLESVADAQHLLAAVHVLPFLEIVQRGAFGNSPFYDAYLGSARIGERLQRERRLAGVITGHLHRALETRLKQVAVLARPVGDARKRSLPLAELATRCWGKLEVPGP